MVDVHVKTLQVSLQQLCSERGQGQSQSSRLAGFNEKVGPR